MNITSTEAQSELTSVTQALLMVSTSTATAAPPAASATKPSDKTFANLATDLGTSTPKFGFGKSTTASG